MKTIIIGASGVIGYELFLELKKKNKNVVGTYNYNKKKRLIKFDIKKDNIIKKIKIAKSDKVVLLTAISNPTWVYANSKFSKSINVTATKKIIDHLKFIGCKVYFMSSIEVFDGKKGNYDENSVPRPLNLYGKQKFYIENYIKKNLKNYCIIRTSFIVAKNPNQRCPVKLTFDSLLKPKAKMATDNFFAITYIHDLCQIMIKLIFNKKLQHLKICHLSSKEKISRIQLARYIIKFSKLKSRMSFKPTLFRYIKYSEPRGRKNNLISLNSIINKFKYKSAEVVIKKKIKIIEKTYEANYSK
tara:strand:+ start:357 stop:1256 length:900 start_codon:yes stop_codon:yes gene_type:complete